jgi:hypothetical protein
MLASIPARGARRHESFLDLSQLGWPEFILCAEGIVLLLTLFFVPWFSTTGYGPIKGHSGDITAWQTYTILRYYLLWCGVGAFLLPWIEARGHHLSWPRSEMTMIHGVAGFGLLFLAGPEFRPGTPSGEIHIQIGYPVGLLAMVALTVRGSWRARLAAPPTPKPPGLI